MIKKLVSGVLLIGNLWMSNPAAANNLAYAESVGMKIGAVACRFNVDNPGLAVRISTEQLRSRLIQYLRVYLSEEEFNYFGSELPSRQYEALENGWTAVLELCPVD